jgi:NADP-dependent 3-hydroxy acid dehydrogenase YdfG
MTNTIIVCGYGPGISSAVAAHFGAAGFRVALVARTASKLEAAVKELKAKGIKAAAFPTDVGDPKAVTSMVAAVRKELGPTTVIHWNAYSASAGDLVSSPPSDIRKALDIGVTGLVAAVQAALPDLRSQKNGAVLVTGGGLAFYETSVDTMAAQRNVMGLAVVKAAQHKLAGLLSARLRPEGIYVGEIVVTGLVRGTAFDTGNARMEPSAIAKKFFEMYSSRSLPTVVLG